jgi:hypothetical protein
VTLALSLDHCGQSEGHGSNVEVGWERLGVEGGGRRGRSSIRRNRRRKIRRGRGKEKRVSVLVTVALTDSVV